MKPLPRLRLGSNVIELLLPQRRPFLMVDFVSAFEEAPRPAIETGRHISANEHYFDGHFPELHVWPGSLTVEGMGQSGVLLMSLLTMCRVARTSGRDPADALDALRALDAGYRLEPAARHLLEEELLARLRAVRNQIAIGTSVEVKFLRPVLAGQRLDFRVHLTGEHEGAIRFECEATVEGTPVATGVLMGTLVTAPTLHTP